MISKDSMVHIICNIKFRNAQQAKIVKTYKNNKLKLLRNNASARFKNNVKHTISHQSMHT